MDPRPPRTTPIATDRAHPYKRHVFVCTTGPECPGDGPAVDIRQSLKRLVKEKGLHDLVRINNSGCLGQCGHGPMMVVYPDNVWYSHLDVESAVDVLTQHILHDLGPVPAHRYTLGPGGCKAVRDAAGFSTCMGACHRAPAADAHDPTN